MHRPLVILAVTLLAALITGCSSMDINNPFSNDPLTGGVDTGKSQLLAVSIPSGMQRFPTHGYQVPGTGGTQGLEIFRGDADMGYVAQTIHPDRWLSLVNRHDDLNRWPAAYSSTREIAMRWVERWATANAERLRHEVAAFAAACGGGEAQSVAAAIRDCRDRATTLGELHEAADRQAGEFAAAAEKHADEIRTLKRVIVNDRTLTQ